MAAIYNPFGLLSPVILPFKLFLQSLWRLKYGWDQKLQLNTHTEWAYISKQWGPYTIRLHCPVIPFSNIKDIIQFYCFFLPRLVLR